MSVSRAEADFRSSEISSSPPVSSQELKTQLVFQLHELLEPILRFMDFSSLKDLRRVSKFWNQLACGLLKEHSVLRLCNVTIQDKKPGWVTLSALAFRRSPKLASPFESINLIWCAGSIGANKKRKSRPLSILKLREHAALSDAQIRNIDVFGIGSMGGASLIYNHLVLPYTSSLKRLVLDGTINISPQVYQDLQRVTFPNLGSLDLCDARPSRSYDKDPREQYDIIDTTCVIIMRAPLLIHVQLQLRTEYGGRLRKLKSLISFDVWTMQAISHQSADFPDPLMKCMLERNDGAKNKKKGWHPDD